MGLLEKAGQINSGEPTTVAPSEPEVKPEPVAAEAGGGGTLMHCGGKAPLSPLKSVHVSW